MASCLCGRAKASGEHVSCGNLGQRGEQSSRAAVKIVQLLVSTLRLLSMCRSLTEALCRTVDLSSIAFQDFVGHGGRKSVGGVKGMTNKEQERVLDQFRQPGRRVLVATAAAEEGIGACWPMLFQDDKTGLL